MHTFKLFVPVCAVLVLFFATNNKVTAAPHPCLWVLDYDHRHPVTTAPAPTTATPELVEQFANLGNKKANELEKVFADLSK